MKKQFILVIHLLFAFDLPAQNKIKFGIKAALGLRLLMNNNDAETGPGYQAGVSSEIFLRENISFQPVLCVSRKGYFYYEGDWLGGSEMINQRLTYLDLLLPVTFNISRKFFLQAGLQAGYLTGARMIYESEGGIFYDDENYAGGILNSMNRFDYGLLAGFGLKISDKIYIDAMANYGLNSVMKENPFLFTSVFDGNNFLATVGCVYWFNFRKKDDLK